MHNIKSASNLDQLVRAVLIIALAFWSYQLILPLFDVLAWGFILAVALYPIYIWLGRRLGNRPNLAVILIMTMCLLLVVGSLVLLTNNMVTTVSDLTAQARNDELSIPQPPDFVKDWPVIGEQLHYTWSAASSNMGTLINKYAKYWLEAGKYLLGKTADISIDLILFIIAVLFSGCLLSKSKHLIPSINKLAERLAPERGHTIVNIMNETIQNISRGVIGLSLIQALLMGVTLLLAGMPGAGLVSFIALLLCIMQLGLFLVIIPIVVWLFFTKNLAFALLFSVILVLIALMDNFLKPFILARGLRTPMLVIFIGVIGGVLMHGVIGIFIGPVILAIFYDLMNHWLQSA